MFRSFNTLRRSIHYSKQFTGAVTIPSVQNEPFKHYAKGSQEREQLYEECQKYLSPDYKPVEIPVIINGKEIKTGNTYKREFPADRSKTLFVGHKATKELIAEAIESSLEVKSKWEALPMDQRASIFLKAADMISGKYRYKVMAATMMGQGKTAWQAEIDSAVETIDFLRFNAKYAEDIYKVQPVHHAPGSWNKLDYRPLEGFVAAISPFNFTAIGANLCCSPLQMGNVVAWKPAHTSLLSNYIIYDILREAGLPDGVLQFLPSNGPDFSEVALNHRDLAGLHFTGSTKTFNLLQRNIANNLENYRAYPRVVGETGGKNFHLCHPSANIDNFVNNSLRGAFEYSGQKCSATSRAYVPASKWEEVRTKLVEGAKELTVGQPQDYSSFLSCVIDEASFDKISGYIDRAKQDPDCEIIAGGDFSKDKGYFVQPTIIFTKNPKSETMREEIFGPVLTVCVYEDSKLDETLDLIDGTSNYGLTGSIFSTDREALMYCSSRLRHAAGNMYWNDKSTGAVVGNQPFGGSRQSGTNDKAGSMFNLLRWISVRSIKENFVDISSTQYPSTQA
uniref:Multifunctional fusion protein n=1 Tax=Percolomonas cosmopolitus TaxID=63605 RepID=A0A7S1PJ73_9EUKA